MYVKNTHIELKVIKSNFTPEQIRNREIITEVYVFINIFTNYSSEALAHLPLSNLNAFVTLLFSFKMRNEIASSYDSVKILNESLSWPRSMQLLIY